MKIWGANTPSKAAEVEMSVARWKKRRSSRVAGREAERNRKGETRPQGADHRSYGYLRPW